MSNVGPLLVKTHAKTKELGPDGEGVCTGGAPRSTNVGRVLCILVGPRPLASASGVVLRQTCGSSEL